MATMVATLDFSKAKDEHGNVMEPEVKFENSVFRYELNHVSFIMSCQTQTIYHSTGHPHHSKSISGRGPPRPSSLSVSQQKMLFCDGVVFKIGIN